MSAPDIVRRPLPAFPGWWRALGPGIVWMALAQGSGELIWWPYLVAKYGLLLLFLLIPSCLLQYPLNLEIGRYTLLTGESIFRGFLRLHRGFGIALWVLMTLSFLWFGAFATAGGTALAALTGFPAGWSPRGQTLLWGYASIALFGAALVFSGVVYRLIENFMKVVALVTVAGLVWACLEPEVLRQVPSFARGLFGPPPGAPARAWDPADATKLLTGITFAGLGGFWILLYSYWLGEKGAGMAGYGQQITGLSKGTAYRVPGTAYDTLGPASGASRADGYPVRGTRYAVPDDSADSRRAYSTWRRYLTIDALIGITGNLFTTLLTCLLAWALLFPKGLLPQDYELAVVQSRFFEVSWGPVGRVVFLLVAAAFLADTWLATADGVSRMQADIVTALFPRATGGSVRRWYWIALGLLTVVTCLTMLLEAPGPLILLSAVIGFAGTVVFPVALYLLNYRRLPKVLPDWARPARASAVLLGVSFVCYLVLAVVYVREVVR
jgi:Mn2+/Fe2+ NRAMP family transporter